MGILREVRNDLSGLYKAKVCKQFRLSSSEDLFNEIPMNQFAKKGDNIVRAAVMIGQVVGVSSHINIKSGFCSWSKVNPYSRITPESTIITEHQRKTGTHLK
jgi:hypothetical protein